jgi:ERCC4-related helicase
MELPEWKYRGYVAALRRYRDLYQARQDTWEGNSRRTVEKLGNVPDEVAGFIRAAAYVKLLHVAWLVKRLANESKRVMVYAKFRQSAHRLQRVLWDEYNMLV